MPLVSRPLKEIDPGAKIVRILADRHTIRKLRWRATAEDGVAFAFDLEELLHNGDAVWWQDEHLYRVQQRSEEALLVQWPGEGRSAAAQLAWNLGNLHQPIELREDGIVVADDPAVRTKLKSLGYSYSKIETVFSPMPHTGAHGHHAHNHAH